MSEPKIVHTVLAGDLDAALKHGLTVKALCGKVWVPSLRKLDGLDRCQACEDLANKQSRPRPHFVYRHFDADGVLLYVGCTVDPKTRALGHQQNSWWWPQSVKVRMTVFPNKLHARRVERDAIRNEAPLWNVRDQDFKSWTSEQLRLVRDLANRLEAPDPVVRRFHKLAGAA